MSSTFFGLNIAVSALMAQRKAIEVTAHNVANANTEGYTRQEAVMKASVPFPVPTMTGDMVAGQLGTGVAIESIRRIRDGLLDYQIREQLWALGSWDTKSSYLEEIESIVNEPSEAGVDALLNKMWASWYDLSNDPGSYVAKASVVQTSSVLADALRRVALQLKAMREGADQEITSKLSDVNSALTSIDALNQQIATVKAMGDDANDLKDQRDLLLDQLSRMLQVGYQEEAEGSVTVWLGTPRSGSAGSAPILVQLGGSPATLTWDTSTAAGQVMIGASDVTVNVQNGEIRALIDLRNGDLDPANAAGFAGRLEALATSLTAAVNNVVNPAGAAGQDFFVNGGTGTLAQGIAVNSTLVGDPGQLPAGDPLLPGDGSIALAVARLQNTAVSVGGKTITLGAWYQEVISRLGIDGKQAVTMAANQLLLVDHLKVNREAQSGVSLDEEAANMIRFERAYQAAARVMTAMDEMLETLVSGVGIVGR